MSYNFLDVLAKQEDTQTTPSPELRESNHPDFKEYEISIAGLTLQETLCGEVPSIDFLTVAHFQDYTLACIYAYCLEAYEASGRVSKVSLKQEIFSGDERAEEFLSHLMMQAVTGKQLIKSMALELDEYLKYKKAKDILSQQLEALRIYRPFSEVSKEMDDMSVQIGQLMYKQIEKQSYSYEEGLKEFKDNFYSDQAKGVMTGLKDLDEALNGFGRGELIVCAGRPGMGKTAFLIHVTANIAEQGHNCLCFNIEMTNDQNKARFISREMNRSDGYRLSYKEIQQAMGSENKQSNIYSKAFRVAENNTKSIHNNYNPTITVNQIINYSERHAQYLQRQGKRLDFIAIDYLQIISMNNKRDAHLEIGEMTGKLKQLAKRLSVPVLLLSQLNRSLEAEKKDIEHRKPQLNHLRQSGKIEEDADKVIFPFRPSYYEREKHKDQREWQDHYMEIIIAKNRSGENVAVKISADMATNYFYDMSQEEDGKTGYIPTSQASNWRA